MIVEVNPGFHSASIGFRSTPFLEKAMAANDNVEKVTKMVRTCWYAIHYMVAKVCGLEARQLSGAAALDLLIEVLSDLRRKWDNSPTKIKTKRGRQQ